MDDWLAHNSAQVWKVKELRDPIKLRLSILRSKSLPGLPH